MRYVAPQFLFFLVFCAEINCAVVYVSNLSNSTSNCGSMELPCGNIASAVTVACNSSNTLSTPSIIYVYSGSYNITQLNITCEVSIQSLSGSVDTFIVPMNDKENQQEHLFTIPEAHTFVLKGFNIQFKANLSLLECRSGGNVTLDDIVIGGTFERLIDSKYLDFLHLTNLDMESSLEGDSLFLIESTGSILMENITISGSFFDNIALVYLEDFNSVILRNWIIETIPKNSLLFVNGLSIGSSIQMENVNITAPKVRYCTCEKYISLTAHTVLLNNMTITQFVDGNTIYISATDVEITELLASGTNSVGNNFLVFENPKASRNETVVLIKDSFFLNLKTSSAILLNSSSVIDSHVDNLSVSIENTIFLASRCTLAVIQKNYNGNLTISGCDFREIFEFEDNPLALIQVEQPGSLEVSDSQFLYNKVSYHIKGDSSEHSYFIVRCNFIKISLVTASSNTRASILSISGALSIEDSNFIGNDLMLIEASSQELTISDCTFCNNTGTKNMIKFQYCNAEVTGCTFEQNNYGLLGIFLDTSFVLMRNSNVVNNTFTTFLSCTIPGLYSSRLFLSDTQFDSNIIRKNGIISLSPYCIGDFRNLTIQHTIGGAIYSSGAQLELHNLVFDGNEALDGAVIFIASDSEFEMENISFVNTFGVSLLVSESSVGTLNQALFLSSNGSSLLVMDRAVVHIENNIFDDNYCSTGGILFAQGESQVHVTNSTFQNNISGLNGGAILLESDALVDIYSSSFFNNSAAIRGGAIAIRMNAILYLNDTTIHSCSSSTEGGAIAASDITFLYMDNCTLEMNHAQSGGAISLLDFSSLNISHSIIQENSADNAGAIVCYDSANIQVFESYFLKNNAIGNGGAILLLDSSFCFLFSCEFEANSAYFGGGLYMDGNSTITTLFVRYFNNSASNGGGGLLIANTNGNHTIAIIECYFVSNRAPNGGGVYLRTTNVAFETCSFYNNSASIAGGGIYLTENTFLRVNILTLTFNTAINGGAIYIGDRSQIDIISSQMNFNTAIQYGGAIHLEGYTSALFAQNSIFTFNTAESGGAIYYIQNAAFSTIMVSIFINNHATTSGGALYVQSISEYFSIEEYNSACSFINNTASLGGALFIDGNGLTYRDSQLKGNAAHAADFGGGNIAFLSISDPENAHNVCEGCTYEPQFTTGYQNAIGFATAPISLDIVDTSCPSSLYLDSEGIAVQIALVDSFGTIVVGDYLSAFPVTVVMNHTSSVIVTNDTEVIQRSGAASFADTTFCAADNSTITMKFLATGFSSTHCSVLLNGCPTGYDVKEEFPCSTCNPTHISLLGIITLISLGITIILCCIIILILAIIASFRLWKRHQRQKHYDLEIPDFSERPQGLTIEDILNDPAIKVIPWEEVEILKEIGQGASGLVSSGVWTDKAGKKKEIALKELLMKTRNFDTETIAEFLIEIKFMSALEHKNVVRFLGICVGKNSSKLFLITELMHHGSLRDLMKAKKGNLPLSLRWRFARDAAKGMSYLHKRKLIHRDLKTDNLLINDTWSCKIADFGISTVRPDITRQMTCIGTPVYMAPEVLNKNKYSEKADVFSFGIVLAELFSGRAPYSNAPYDTMNHAQLMNEIVEGNARPCIDDISPAMQQLILDCWNLNPNLRPSFKESIIRLERIRSTLDEGSIDLNDGEEFSGSENNMGDSMNNTGDSLSDTGSSFQSDLNSSGELSIN